MRSRRILVILSCLTVLGLLLASCASSASPVAPAAATPKAAPSPQKADTPAAAAAPSATAKPSAEQPRSGGVLTRTNPEDVPHLDVHQLSTISQLVPVANVYNGLARFDTVELNKVVPDLAERWDASADGANYTFFLRKDVKWHDGKPFTSEDVKFSLERMAFWKDFKIVSPRGGALLTSVTKVEAPDANTVKVILKYPSASFMDSMASGWILILPKHLIEAKGDMKKDAIGTGAFKWKDWSFGISNELVKNPDYFVKGLPYLDGIKIYAIKDGATRLAAFMTGQVKMTPLGSKGLTHAEAARMRKDMADKAQIITHPAAARYILAMNQKREPWGDMRVRQAVDLAFDRQSAIAVNGGVGTVGAAMHPKGNWGISEDEMLKRPGYRPQKDEDIAKAKTLLAEAGFPKGFKTKLLIWQGGASEQQGVVAKDQLAKLGIEATIEVKDLSTVTDLQNRKDFDVLSYIISDALDDPDPILGGIYTSNAAKNWVGFSDKQVDDLFAKQAAILDPKERMKVVIELQQRILDQVITPVIFWDAYNMGFWKEVRGYMPGFGAFGHNNLDHVWLAK